MGSHVIIVGSNVAPGTGELGAAVGNRDGLAVATVGASVGTRVKIVIDAPAGIATLENEEGMTSLASPVNSHAIDKCPAAAIFFLRA